MTRAQKESARKLIEAKKPLVWTGTFKELARKMPRENRLGEELLRKIHAR